MADCNPYVFGVGRDTRMKALFWILIVLSVIAAIAGCANSDTVPGFAAMP
jgi:cytochrome b subunit of formate dehydrogenase